MRTLIIIPTYNEAENLKPITDAVLAVTPSEVEVLIVDDGSPDGTGKLADQLAAKNPRFHVIHRAKKMGLGTAYVNGFSWAIEKNFDAIVEMDADFSHNPQYLPQMLDLLTRHEGVIGSRYVPGGGTLNWGLGRRLISRGGSIYSRAILGAPIRDFTGGFNGWKKALLEAVDYKSLKSDGYSFQIELKYRAFRKRFSLVEFPIVFEDRKVGKSKMNRRIVFEALLRVWQFRKASHAPRIGLILLALAFFFNSSASLAVAAQKATTAILVDKKTNTLDVCEYDDSGHYKIIKTYHATLGQVKGDKEQENDLKTPEGIYTFTSVQTPPLLPRKFGLMSFSLNFPNTFDHLAGRTGNGIMLHATNEPDRLKKNYDSQGCVVVKNEEISEIKPYIRLGLTPILIFSELTDEYLKPGADPQLKTFFESWVKDWENKDIEKYMDHYHSDFAAQGKNKSAWKDFKISLNHKYSSIEIGPENVRYYRHPKYWMVTFTQNYRSKLKGGGWGHRSRGTKILYIAEENNQSKIIAETFTQLMW